MSRMREGSIDRIWEGKRKKDGKREIETELGGERERGDDKERHREGESEENPAMNECQENVDGSRNWVRK